MSTCELHQPTPSNVPSRVGCSGLLFCGLVGPTGIEPVASSMSTKRSPTELRTRKATHQASLDLRPPPTALSAHPAVPSGKVALTGASRFLRYHPLLHQVSFLTIRVVSPDRSCWSGRQDSNLRPSASKADTLPDCATPRWCERFIKIVPCGGCLVKKR